MRRFDHKKGSSKLKAQLLEQFCDLRARISASHPGLLDSIAGSLYVDETQIDRGKNLRTVKKFLEIAPDQSEWFQAKLKEVLQENAQGFRS